jgi:hypothetical protein
LPKNPFSATAVRLFLDWVEIGRSHPVECNSVMFFKLLIKIIYISSNFLSWLPFCEVCSILPPFPFSKYFSEYLRTHQ